LTGGGSQLKHVHQLTEFTTGIETRIGYPNEHLAKDVSEDMASPMYATGIGLVIEGIKRYEMEIKTRPSEVESEPGSKKKKTTRKTGGGFFGPIRFADKIKDWFEADTQEEDN
jgi:cell division protein FtsA